MFSANLNAGDCGLILSDNIFSTMQNWMRLKNKEPKRASHAFMLTNPPELTEANGLRTKKGEIYKFIGNSTKCWVFRNKKITPGQIDGIQDYCNGIVEGGGTYAVGSILQFALQYIGIRKKLSDETGMFCSELAVRSYRNEKLSICGDRPSYAISPSELLSWFYSDEALKNNWILSSFYDGKYYWIEESI